MNYNDAVKDANLATNVNPLDSEAYKCLSEFLVTQNQEKEARDILQIVLKHENDQMLKNTCNSLKSNLASKQAAEPARKVERIQQARNQVTWKNEFENSAAFKTYLEGNNEIQADKYTTGMASEVGVTHKVFLQKRQEFKDRYHNVINRDAMLLSDEEGDDGVETYGDEKEGEVVKKLIPK